MSRQGMAMADGDEIHANLPRRYLNNYQDLCAPDFNPEDVAHDLARVVRDDVRSFGNGPVNFIQDCVETLASQLAEEPLLRSTVDYGAVHQQIDLIGRQHRGSEQGMELAKRVLRRAVETYRQGDSFTDATGAVRDYLSNIHEARFSDRVPLTSEHQNGMTAAQVVQRLDAMMPYARKEYMHLARSIVRQGDVNRRLHRRRYDNGLGLYDVVR